jgi:hypothetical protein
MTINKKTKNDKEVISQKNSINELEERSKVSGSTSAEFTELLRKQVVVTFNEIFDKEEGSIKNINKAIKGMMSGITPQNELEGMLVAQIIALHNATMRSFMREHAMSKHPTSTILDSCVNQAVKLSRTSAILMQTLHLLRNNNQENKVNVGRVHVHDGGQAIVGNVVKKTERCD